MSSPGSSWHLLPPDLIEHQIGQIDLLMAMYPTEDEVTLDRDSAQLLESLKSAIETDTPNTPATFRTAPAVTLLLRLAVPEADDKTLQLDITVPFSHPGPSAPEDPPRIAVRVRQPPWLSRAATATLNSEIPETEDLFSTIESVNEAAAAAAAAQVLSSAAEDAASSLSSAPDGPLVRVWFYFPSISTRSKRDDFIIYAPSYRLTGFLYAGKPGLLCVEGASQSIDDYMKFIKTESWGDIPAHHKKVSERHREKDVERVFPDMEEITDSVGTRHGQRANRGDMKAVESWLSERGLGDAFTKVLM